MDQNVTLVIHSMLTQPTERVPFACVAGFFVLFEKVSFEDGKWRKVTYI